MQLGDAMIFVRDIFLNGHLLFVYMFDAKWYTMMLSKRIASVLRQVFEVERCDSNYHLRV